MKDITRIISNLEKMIAFLEANDERKWARNFQQMINDSRYLSNDDETSIWMARVSQSRRPFTEEAGYVQKDGIIMKEITKQLHALTDELYDSVMDARVIGERSPTEEGR